MNTPTSPEFNGNSGTSESGESDTTVSTTQSKASDLLAGAYIVDYIDPENDPYLWLEEVDSVDSMQFVARHNAITLERLTAHPAYASMTSEILSLLNSREKIEYPNLSGDFVYNFWKDETHQRGVWRRTQRDAYFNRTHEWETLLDIDALSKNESVEWNYAGSLISKANPNSILVHLSPKGSDAKVTREFNPKTKEFIQEGFNLPKGKHRFAWFDENTLLVCQDAPGCITTSGYPRKVQLWKRGVEVNDAPIVFEGAEEDISVSVTTLEDGNSVHYIIRQSKSFFSGKYFLFDGEKLIQLDIPLDSNLETILHDEIFVSLRSDLLLDGVTFPKGSLISYSLPELISGLKNVRQVFAPGPREGILNVCATKNTLLVNYLSDVVGRICIFSKLNNEWVRSEVEGPGKGSIELCDIDDIGDEYFFVFEDFVTQPTLYHGNAIKNTSKIHTALPSQYNVDKYQIQQFHAVSKDGTKIPYFVVNVKGVPFDGKQPTLLYAYGGFEVSMNPFYSLSTLVGWLEQGGTFVVANIRGGGEFGPEWHQAGVKDRRQNVYDDFFSVSEDIIAKGITSPSHLGISGASNGGLLMGVAITQRPDLYNAIICDVPLLDMKRYNQLLAGASWMAEYGNPDIAEEWEYISKYSPYHNIKPGVSYPETLFMTSTHDDRVHPAHARKMVARMEEFGVSPLYYENTEGGHTGMSSNENVAKELALKYCFLLDKLR